MGRKRNRKRSAGPNKLPPRPKRPDSASPAEDQKQWNILGLLYQQVEANLYGVIHTVRGELDNQETSQVFLISRQVGGKEIVYGSVLHLLDKIIGLLSIFEYDLDLLRQPTVSSYERTQRAIDVREPMSLEDAIMQQQDKIIEDTTLLVALHFRTLSEIFSGRFRREISVYGTDDQEIDRVQIKAVADNLVHSRYFVINDRFIDNIASAKDELPYRVPFEPKVDAFEFFDAVLDVIRHLRVNDLIGVLRRGLATISADSDPRHVIFLVQNIHTLARVVNDNLESPNSSPIVDMLLDKEKQRITQWLNETRPQGVDSIEFKQTFTAPRFKIHEDLSRPQLQVSLRINDKPETLDIDSRRFFEVLAGACGRAPLIADVPQPKPVGVQDITQGIELR